MIDLPVTFAGLCVGLIVGLTGMGGGALMTPVLVLLFGLDPLTAVSSDLAASMLMKPVGAAVHLRRETVHRRMVLWLVLGSVPAAFAGVLLLRRFGALGLDLQASVKTALGVALLAVVGALLLRPLLSRRRATKSITSTSRTPYRSRRQRSNPGRKPNSLRSCAITPIHLLPAPSSILRASHSIPRSGISQRVTTMSTISSSNPPNAIRSTRCSSTPSCTRSRASNPALCLTKAPAD